MCGPGTPPPQGASPPATAPRGVKRPKWRLGFRLDCCEGGPGAAREQRRDFFISIIDPPVCSVAQPPAPFFASEVACRVADLLTGRRFLEHLPGRSFEGRTVAAVGKDCLTAGLAAGMLGAKVALVCERQLLRHVQQNVRLYLRDTLDYTSTKSVCVTAVAGAPGAAVVGPALCEQLRAAPTLDLALLTESAVPCLAGLPGRRDLEAGALAAGAREPPLFEALGELVPTGAPTRVLLVCDGPLGLEGEEEQGAGGQRAGAGADGALPARLALPPGWRAKACCRLSGQVPAVWLERQDAEAWRAPARRPPGPGQRLPAMQAGAGAGACDGAGGRPRQDPARLKEALALHNRWKQGEAAVVLEEALFWAAAAAREQRQPPQGAACQAGRAPPPAWGSEPGAQEADGTGAPNTGACAAGPGAPGGPPARAPGPAEAAREPAAAAPGSGDPAAPGPGGPAPLPPLVAAPAEPAATHALPSAPSAPAERRARPPSSARAAGAGSGAGAACVGSACPEQGIAERHARPQHWYRCNRAVYGAAA